MVPYGLRASLLSLYVALSGQLITQLVDLHKQNKRFIIDGTIDAMKRNVVIEIVLIVLSLVLLTIKSFVIVRFVSFSALFSVGANSLVVFTILYFILVIYDSFTGLFKLVKINGSE